MLELPSLRVTKIAATVASTRPLLINRDPGPDETNVAINWPISLRVFDPGPDGIDKAATRIWVNDVLAFDGDILPGFNGPLNMVDQLVDELIIRLSPILPFESMQVVLVRVVSQTNGGAHLLDETYSFTVEDRTAPRVLAAQAIGPRTVRIGFDEPVQVIDPIGFMFTRLDFPAVPISPDNATFSGSIVDVSLNTEMTPDVPCAVTITGVTDLNDNPILPPYDTAEFIGYRPARPGDRRFDLWKMIPKYNRRADDTGDLWRFISCLQEVTDLLLAEVDRFPDIFDIERAPSAFLGLILLDLGSPFEFDLDELGERRLASVLLEMYKMKGTALGIKSAIRFFLGIEIEIIPFTADTLMLGESELGIDWILGPSDRFALYSFNIRVDQVLTETERKQIRAIVTLLKPGHTHFIDLIEPFPPPTFDHWELGVSELGISSELH
ncbi:MAG: phage tail protein [Deltaproteobacteria bacterium]|nr:phage tail protein [Deltaproteobacteria bacterium]